MGFCSIISMGVLRIIFGLMVAAAFAGRAGADDVPFSKIRPILAKHCIGCHDAKEAEGGLVMENYSSLMNGGDDGAAIVAGKADQSPLIRQVEYKDKPFMPPAKKNDRLSAAEIALLRQWIDGGAKGPAAGEDATIAVVAAVPKVAPQTAPRRAVPAMGYGPKKKLLAGGAPNRVVFRA